MEELDKLKLATNECIAGMSELSNVVSLLIDKAIETHINIKSVQNQLDVLEKLIHRNN